MQGSRALRPGRARAPCLGRDRLIQPPRVAAIVDCRCVCSSILGDITDGLRTCGTSSGASGRIPGFVFLPRGRVGGEGRVERRR